MERRVDDMGVLLSVGVNPEDMGKIIGKSGQTAKSVRTLLKIVGAKHDARVNMKIIEPEDGLGVAGGAGAGTVAGSAADSSDAIDDESVRQDDRDDNEAEDAQRDSDAAQAVGQNENNSEVDEETGQTKQEPALEGEEDRALNEKSPLDEL